MKIPCVTMVFHELDVIKKHLESLTKLSDRLEIYVVENYSPNSNLIAEHVHGLLDTGLVKAQYIFSKNVANNAIETILRSGHIPRNNPYILITDGDLTADPTFLDEQLDIIQRTSAQVCAVDLDTSNLPLKTFPESINWHPKKGFTGGHLLLMRKWVLDGFLSTGEKFLDVNLHKYVTKKFWARTKINKAHHLTWDLYADLNHPYTKLKLSKTWDETWNASDTCDYTVFTKK